MLILQLLCLFILGPLGQYDQECFLIWPQCVNIDYLLAKLIEIQLIISAQPRIILYKVLPGNPAIGPPPPKALWVELCGVFPCTSRIVLKNHKYVRIWHIQHYFTCYRFYMISKNCKNPLAQLAILLAPSCWVVGYVEPCMYFRFVSFFHAELS